MEKEKWKYIVKKKVRDKSVAKINEDILAKSKSKALGTYEKLSLQPYLKYVKTEDARLMFKVRSGTIDFKACRSYQYNDKVCRLCKSGI